MKEKLSYFHVSILIFMIQTGRLLFRNPQQEAEYFGTNGWLSVFICAGAALLNIGLIAAVYRFGKGRSIFDILEQSIPKAVLFPLYLSLMSVWALVACLSAKEYVVILQMVAFPTANPMLFMITLVILAMYLLSKGIYNISKAATVFFFLVIWMALLLFYFYGDFSWARLTPFVFQDARNSIRGFFDLYSAFLGYELCLLLFPYADPKKKVIKSAVVGNMMTTMIYAYIGIICFGFYSLDQLKLTLFPVLDLLAYIRLPFMERIENLFYGFFLFANIIMVAAFYWSAAETGLRILPRMNRNLLAAFIILATIFVSIIPVTLMEVEAWLRNLGYIEIGIAFGLPILLIPLAFIQHKRGVTSHVHP